MRTRRGRRLGRGWRARLGFGVAMAVGAVTLPGCARAPSVATIDPAAGPTTGGTTVTVTGTVFKDVRQVRFGEVDAEFTVRSETEIEVVAPPGDEGSVRVTVVTASGTSAPETAPVFTYLPEAEPGPDTVVVGDEDVVDVAANDGTGGGTLTLAADATAPDMGSIVSSAAGTGLIGRVTSVVEEPGGLVVETGSVALAEAFPSGAFDTNVSSGDAAAPGAGASGAEAMPGGGAGDAAGSPSRGAAAVGDLHCGSTVVEGSATLDAADFDLDVHAAWGPLVTDELSVTGSISVTGTVAVSGQLTGDCWITLLGPAFGPPVPVVPGVLTLTSVFRGKLNLDADIDIVGASATVTASGRVGVGWNEKRGLHPIVDLDPPDVDVDTSSLLSRGFVGTGRAAIGGDVTILVNALLGPSVFIGPYLEIDADTQRNPWLKVNGGLLVSASFT